MQSRFYMMSGVKPEVSGSDIIQAVHDIVRGLKVIIGMKSSVMAVGVPTGDKIAKNHRNNKNHQRIKPIEITESNEKQKNEPSHS